MLLSIIFKLAHIAVVSIFITYIVKKWILPVIRHSFLHNEKVKTQLYNQANALHEEHATLTQLIHQEELRLVQLQQTIEQWRIKEEKRTEYINIAYNARRQFAQKQAIERIITQKQKRQDAFIMAEALARAKNTLSDHFAQNIHEAKQYNTCIIDHMRKS